MIENRTDEIERFKTDINLAEYASSQGYEIDKRESSKASVVMRNGHGDKIVVATDKDGHGVYFSVRSEADNGSIIDFVQKRKGLNLGQVRKELRPWLNGGIDPHSFSYRPLSKPEASTADRQRVTAEWMKTRRQPAGGHPYLLSRGISQQVLEDPRFAEKIRIDNHGNAVFPHYDRDGLSGYELKNKGFTGFAKGGEKRLWYSENLGSAERVVVVESAIDALSHAQIRGGQAAYISIGGQPSPEQWELVEASLAKARKRGAQVVIGTDADEGGDKLAKRLAELAPGADRERPKAKDWNEQVLDVTAKRGVIAAPGR
jgi:5S rRNA maturation endonuclease (ribonuclease M5)